MAKASPAKTNFNTGEVTPLLAGRVDLEQYRNALKTSVNGIPMLQGGWTRRPGMKFCAEVKNHSEKCYLYPFEFSVTQAYMLIFGEAYLRFIRNQGLITLTAQNITGATAANPVVITIVGHGYSNGDRVVIAGVGGMTQLNNREFAVAGATADTFQLSGVNGSGYDAYTSGGTAAKVYEIVSPYAGLQPYELKAAQSADVLYIAHPLHPPHKLTRTGHTAWTITAIDFQDGPYLSTNTTAIALTPSAATGVGVTLTATSALFAASDVGRLIRIKEGSTWGWVKIVGYTSSTVVTVDIKSTLTNMNAKTTWRLGAWSATTGYPACVTFFEDRLFFAGATSTPQRIDGSETGGYETFSPTAFDGTVAADNALAFTLNSNDVNTIRWLIDDEKGLMAGTVGGEWIIRPSAQNEALSPTNITAKQSTSYGSANIPAVKAGKAALFVNRSARKLRELAYVFEVDGFRAPDMNVLAEHITKGGIVDIAYQKEPQSIFWLPRTDGTLLSFTYEREQQVLGWSRHSLGGYSNSGQSAPAIVESAAAIPVSDASRDELYVVVQRYVNGAIKRYIEYGAKLWEEDDAAADAVFLDSALTYSGAPVSALSGLWHLEGQTVGVWANGATHPDRTVVNGKITLNDDVYTKVAVGLKYNSDGQMLRIEAGAADGTAQGKLQRAHRVIVRVWKTLGLKLGYELNDATMYRPPMRTSAMDTDTAVELFTGDIEATWEGNYTTENYICWRFDQPAPGTVLAVYPQLHTQDR